jgi:Bacteriophage clamp loader A subunit
MPTKKKTTEIKNKGLFDHLNEIREGKSADYYNNLTEQEKKTFNQYVILMGLSMDKECIEEVSYISKYLNLMPDKQFYKVCCDIIPYGKKFSKWIKSSKVKFDKEIINKLSIYYKIGGDEANEYCEILVQNDKLLEILSKFGMTEKEVKKLLK